MNTIEHTLIIFKPDALQRGLVGEILTRFEKVGLKIVGSKLLKPTRDHLFHHYETIGQMITRRGQRAFDDTVSMVENGPLFAFVLEGVEAVSLVRKMVGATEPKNAVPGTIRGDYAHMSFTHADAQGVGLPNLIHASGNVEEAKSEIEHWFKKDEIYSYEASHEFHTQTKKN